jgi:hypothetical protein
MNEGEEEMRSVRSGGRDKKYRKERKEKEG